MPEDHAPAVSVHYRHQSAKRIDAFEAETNPRVEFQTATGRVTVHVDSRGRLSVRGEWGYLHVLPESGNAITIIPEED